MNGRCKEMVLNDRFPNYPCSRKDWKDGYCKQHHPDSVKKRRDDAYAKFTAKMVAVADTMYQAKVAEEAALQDEQRRQSEENVQLRLENERLREALNRFEYSSDGHIKRYPEEEEVIAALRREDEK